MRWLRRFVAKAVSGIVCPFSGFRPDPSIALSGRCSQSPRFFVAQLVSSNPLALECPKRLRHHAGRILEQTAAALYFIIFGQLSIRTESLSLRLGASYEPCLIYRKSPRAASRGAQRISPDPLRQRQE